MTSKKELRINWEKYGKLLKELLNKVRSSGDKFDMVIGISRGGLMPALALSYGLGDIPLAIMAAQSYNLRKKNDRIVFSRHLVMTTKDIGRRCLLVDDLTDSGVTLKESTHFLKAKYGKRIRTLKTAVIFVKRGSIFEPDFYVKRISRIWVKFFYEGLIPDESRRLS